MAEVKITASNFSLKSSWNCKVVYHYNSNGSFNSVYSVNQSTPNKATKTVSFATGLSSSTKILSVKVHAVYTIRGWQSGNFKINDVAPDSNGFVTLNNSSISNGSVSVIFSWQANKDTSTNHNKSYPSSNGQSSQSVTYPHDSEIDVTDAYILVEYQSGSIIYHAENGVLVPYQLFHAEDGKLVPYQIQHGEGGILIPY